MLHEEILDFLYLDIMKEDDQYYCGLFNDLSRQFIHDPISGFWSDGSYRGRYADPKNGQIELQKDLMCYTVCHQVTDSIDMNNLIFNLQTICFHRPSDEKLNALLLELPIQYIIAFQSLPTIEEYNKINKDQLKCKTWMILKHYLADVVCFSKL